MIQTTNVSFLARYAYNHNKYNKTQSICTYSMHIQIWTDA